MRVAPKEGCSRKGGVYVDVPSNSSVKAPLMPSPGYLPSTVFLSAMGEIRSPTQCTNHHSEATLTFVSQKGTSRHLSNAMQLD